MNESFNKLKIDIIGSPTADPFQQAMRMMLIGWQQYAVAYREKYEEPISDDLVIAYAYRELGKNLQSMLWGDIGDLPFARVEGLISDVLVENGY